MHFGALTPQGWKHDLDGLGAREGFEHMIAVTQRLEQKGFDSAWLYDHFHAVPAPAQPGTLVFECWTAMMALAMRTSTIRLGQMVTCTSYRNAGYLAKISSCVDVASNGRLEMGIGGGWYQDEFDAYGYGFPEPKGRLGHLRDTVEILKAMWTQDRATHDGTYARITNALNDPKPLQQTPPVWIGGGGENVTLRITARHADWANLMGAPEILAHKRDVLRAHCEQIGRDPAEVKLSWHGEALVARDDAHLREILQRHPSIFGADPDARAASHLIGTTAQVIDKIGAMKDLGFEGFVVWFPDYPSTDTLDLFAEQIIPAFR